jgi:hypothetical protein
LRFINGASYFLFQDHLFFSIVAARKVHLGPSPPSS